MIIVKKEKYSEWRSISTIKLTLALLLLISFYSSGNAYFDKCLLSAVKSAENSTTVEQIKKQCLIKANSNVTEIGVISSRSIQERETAFDPYVITPHKMNYILPVISTNNLNKEAYQSFGDWSENFESIESKFQISLKIPLNQNDIFIKGDRFFAGFTLQSWWQIYADNISKPFRETNYQPEVFYVAPLNWHILGGNTGIMLGLEHQSNGRSQLLSRSWNRAYLNFLYEKGNFALSFKPWFRLSEEAKETELSPEGDDNPDISDYMGHFELSSVYKLSDYEFSMKGRQNFSEHHGGIELGVTFPLWGKLRGFAQYTAGYGESLIDYNHKQQRFGLGIALTNAL